MSFTPVGMFAKLMINVYNLLPSSLIYIISIQQQVTQVDSNISIVKFTKLRSQRHPRAKDRLLCGETQQDAH